MSTDYRMVCYTCKSEGPIYASGSISYGFTVWAQSPELMEWLGHGDACGKHEGHDLRIVSEHNELPWETASGEI